jgi:hypothetical protein
MTHPGFGPLWKQAEMSDVVIVLSIAHNAASTGDETPQEVSDQALSSYHTVLQQFPGHSPILSPCPYFAAQARTLTLSALG